MFDDEKMPLIAKKMIIIIIISSAVIILFGALYYIINGSAEYFSGVSNRGDGNFVSLTTETNWFNFTLGVLFRPDLFVVELRT